MPRDKQKHAESCRQYREANKEKIAEYDRQYRQKNKEKRAEQNRQYHEANKEQRNKYQKQYRENNKEKKAEYYQTPKGKKNMRIYDWKRNGVKLSDDYPDWSLFYEEEYMKVVKCEECFVELTEGKRTTPTTKCLDHCHITGEFRNILCHRCNVKRK